MTFGLFSINARVCVCKEWKKNGVWKFILLNIIKLSIAFVLIIYFHWKKKKKILSKIKIKGKNRCVFLLIKKLVLDNVAAVAVASAATVTWIVSHISFFSVFFFVFLYLWVLAFDCLDHKLNQVSVITFVLCEWQKW